MLYYCCCITVLKYIVLSILQEIDSAIKNLKSGKATGSDDIRNEYISYENKQLRPALKLLFNEIYDTGIYPAQWCSGIIVPIYKKGNR